MFAKSLALNIYLRQTYLKNQIEDSLLDKQNL